MPMNRAYKGEITGPAEIRRELPELRGRNEIIFDDANERRPACDRRRIHEMPVERMRQRKKSRGCAPTREFRTRQRQETIDLQLPLDRVIEIEAALELVVCRVGGHCHAAGYAERLRF